MKFFIALSYHRRKALRSVVSIIQKLLADQGHTYEVFVYRKIKGLTNSQMMKLALNYVQRADVLIAEVSTKEVGIGIELGVAFANNKKIILVRKRGSEHSVTMEGIASHSPIEYKDGEDLKKKLGSFFKKNQWGKGNLGPTVKKETT
jgi:hypothetical protein